jgi:MFS family permease
MYVTQDLNTSRTIAGFSLGILQIGGMVGRPGWGWISDKFLHGSRIRGLILVGGFLALVTLLFSIFITRYNPSLFLIYIASFILGIIAMGWMGLFFTTVAELVSPTLTGIGTGFALVFTRTGAVISPPVFGYIADVYGSYSYSWMAMSLVVFILTLVFIVTSGQLTSRTPGKQPYDHESSQ